MSEWNFRYSKQNENLGNAFVRIVYNDGKVIEPLSKHYNGLKRTGMKSATIVSSGGKPLYTLQIADDRLIYRKKNIVPSDIAKRNHFKKHKQILDFKNPKRAIILATKGKIVYYWDSGEIKELNDWTDEEPYTCPTVRDDEK